MYRTDPKPHWLAGGKLAYRALVNGKPRARVFDPGSESIAPPASTTSKAHRARVVAPGLMSYSPPVREVPSPDGKWYAGTRSGNLWLRPADSGGQAVPLTRDATQSNRYTVLGARWSPDGRYLAVRRMDYRGVPTIPLVDWKRAGEPAERWPYSRAGEPLVRQALVIVDRGRDDTREITLDKALTYLHPVSWSPDGRYLYLMATTRLMKRLELVRVDGATGKVRVLLDEKAHTNVDGAQSYLFVRGYAPQLTALHYVTVLADGRFVWTSERDGWRRLYLYGADGKLIRALTPAKLPVVRVVGLDGDDGILYYVGQAKRGRPYENALFAVHLTGGAPREVAFGPRFYQIRVREDGRYVAVFHGGLDGPPTLDVYDGGGKLMKRLWSAAPIFRRFETRPPEPVVVKAADGKTSLYGMVFKPRGFDARRRYPVVEIIYGGPQDHIVARWQAGQNYWSGEALANRGFVVVEVDARGTPGRGRAFANAFHGRIGQGEISDHVAALQEIAAKRPWMDMNRVGVFGHSWGGYFAARALLQAPDLYRAAVASAGPASLRDFRVPIEPYMGCLPAQCPGAYRRGSNTALAGSLKGRLLIMQGTADRDVPFGESMRLISALEKAGKDYQYTAFPGSSHTIYYSPYWWHRIVGFFRRTLGTVQLAPQ